MEKERAFSCAASNGLPHSKEQQSILDILKDFLVAIFVYVFLVAEILQAQSTHSWEFLRDFAAVLRSHDYFQTARRHRLLHHRYIFTSAQDQR